MRLRPFIGLVALVCITACDDAAPAKSAEASSKSADSGAKAGDAKPADTPEAAKPAAAALDVCASLTAADVQAALGVSDALDASKDHMRVMGTFDGWCAYRAGAINRAQITLAPDAERKDFGKLESMAAPDSPMMTPAEPVGGNAALAKADGSLVWHAGGRLYSVAVFDDKGLPVKADGPRRALATATAAKLSP